jgi:hypothetical protein
VSAARRTVPGRRSPSASFDLPGRAAATSLGCNIFPGGMPSEFRLPFSPHPAAIRAAAAQLMSLVRLLVLSIGMEVRGFRRQDLRQESVHSVPAFRSRGIDKLGEAKPFHCMKNAANDKLIWAYLLHLSYNMWSDREIPGANLPYYAYKPYLRCEKPLWDEILELLVREGMNMVVIDLGDAVRYDSHPEIAVKNAWSPTQLRRELARIRKMGLEPIPKLNFSTCHDAWLGKYSRMVSTEPYYEVCRDLIAEVIELFDRPRLFHIGMDEENLSDQRHFNFVVIRQHELYWSDLYFYLNEVEKGGSRAWVWSDYIWNNRETFLAKMPKSVLQSNWYYEDQFRKTRKEVRGYLDLEEHGYDQVPTTSNWSAKENTQRTVDYCTRHISPERLKGFCQTVWRPTLSETRPRHVDCIKLIGKARRSLKRGK